MRDAVFEGGADGFFFVDTNERWQEVLDAEDLALHEQANRRVLDPACAQRLEDGPRRRSASAQHRERFLDARVHFEPNASDARDRLASSC